MPSTQAHNRQWYVWRIHWRIGKEHQSSGCQSIFVPCTVISSCRILKWYLRYVKLVRYSLFRSVPFGGRKKIKFEEIMGFWANSCGEFVQMGIWCIFIISSSWVSNRVNKLTVCLSSASIGFRRKMQISWGKPKDCESPGISEEKTFYGRLVRWWKI